MEYQKALIVGISNYNNKQQALPGVKNDLVAIKK